MNIQQAKDFMKIYPGIDKCMYQTFDDAKKGRPLARAGKYLTEESLEGLRLLNEQGAGIYFSVNGNDTESRLQKDVTHINAWITEIDHINKEDQKVMISLSPLPPSIVIESKNGYHLYRFAKEGKIENWNKICRGIRNFFEGDPAVITLERILRLPGFDHCKDESDKFEIAICDGNGEYYTELQMLTAFSNFETYQDRKDKQAKAEAYQKKYESDNDDNFRKRVGDIDSEQMLEILSGTKYVNGDVITFKRNSDSQKQIWVNGKSTGCWIDSAGKIGTGKGAGGGPTRKQRVAWYGSFDGPELYKLIIDKFPAFKPKPKEGAKQQPADTTKEIPEDYLVGYDRDFKVDYTNIVPFTRGLEKLDNRFGRIDRGRFITTIGESGSGKTTFVFEQLIEISKNYKVLFISLEMTAERVIQSRARKSAGITIKQRDDKTMTSIQKDLMDMEIKKLQSNTNLDIRGINKKAEEIDIDIIIKSLKSKFMDYDYFVIDNLGFIKAPSQAGKGGNGEVNHIIRELKKFCHDNNKTVNLIHHFNKGSQSTRKDRTFADVRDTGKLENDIDSAIFISRAVSSAKEWEDATPEDRAMVYIDLTKDREDGKIIREVIYFYGGKYNPTYPKKEEKEDDEWK